ncbi:VWA domain-containing protein [Candidatus Woesearchaeota archaeon]|nr:VWA domain-containing protein [Candidatus Woesearchaeota archaeon]
MGINKKGIYFTLDAFFSTMLLLIGIILITKFTFQEISTEQMDMVSKDLLVALGEIKVGEINNPWVESLINNSVIVNPNSTVIEQVGTFWSLNTSLGDERAQNLIGILIEGLIPSIYSMNVTMGGETIYSQIAKPGDPLNLVTSRRMITGVAEGEVAEGSSSSAYIRKIKNKRTSSYIYFGGFIGQGNITVFIDNLPTDVDANQITDITLELDPAESFDFLINDQLCNSSLPAPTLNMSPYRWNVTHCKNLTVPIRNNFSINFPSTSNASYVSGGYIKLTYLTNQTHENISRDSKYYYFPDIRGLINIYDGFYVPGILNSMEINLHYFSNHSSNQSSFSTYLSLADTIVYNDSNSTTEKNVVINNDVLSGMLNYSFLSQKTVPIRMSSYEQVFETIITGGNADVVLITDYSGSMKKSVSDWSQGHAGNDCAAVYSDPSIRRTQLAICLDIEFIDIVMNYSGNRFWPVFLHEDVVKYYDDPENITGIKNFTNSFPFEEQGKGKTCLACAINKGYDLLQNNSDETRQKFIVVMTDGVPTHCADGSCSSNSSVYGLKQCEGLCDVSGACDFDEIPGQCTECTNNDGAIENAIYSANRSRKDMNVTLYSIGFGPLSDCSKANYTLNQIAELGNGTYSHSNNVSMLKIIYEEIAYDILERTEQVSQRIVMNESSASSILYGDSNILLNYTPVTPELQPSEVSVVFQTEQFNSCSPTVNIFDGLRIADARITSYSDEHWTDLLIVNNQTVFSLQDYSDDYFLLGDPFHVEIPPNILVNGDNNISIRTADSPTNLTGCSDNNTMIYRGMVNFSSTRSEVKKTAEGCVWNVEFEDGSFTTLTIPGDYVGGNICSYTSASISYNSDDSYDVSSYGILTALDYDDDGRVLFNFATEDLEVVVNVVEGIRYMWGPSIMDVRIWQ